MTTIILPPDIEKPLLEQALLRGTTPELLALDILREQVVTPDTPCAEASSGSLAERLSPFIGMLQSSERIAGGAAMSVDSGRKFAEGLTTKHVAGRSS